MHRQVPKGLDARRPPALGFAPLDGQHVVGEDRPKDLRLQAGGFETFGAQLDSQVGCLDGEGGGQRSSAARQMWAHLCAKLEYLHVCCRPPCFATEGGTFLLSPPSGIRLHPRHQHSSRNPRLSYCRVVTNQCSEHSHPNTRLMFYSLVTTQRVHTHLPGICFLSHSLHFYRYKCYLTCVLYSILPTKSHPHPHEHVWVPLCLHIANLCLSLPTT